MELNLKACKGRRCAEGVTGCGPKLFIQEKPPDRKSIIQSRSDTWSTEILAAGKLHISAFERSLMYTPLKIYTLAGECVTCVHMRVLRERGGGSPRPLPGLGLPV